MFPISNLSGFFRYVRLDFLTHYGAEYYCPVSLVRVYGLTQIDAYRRDQDRERKRARSSTASVVATRVVTTEETTSAPEITSTTTVEPHNATTPTISSAPVNSTTAAPRPQEETEPVSPVGPSANDTLPSPQNSTSTDESPSSPQQTSGQKPRDNPGESIYGTIMKRLKALESNQSLSHSYVEEHGRLLRGAFARVDHRLEDFDSRVRPFPRPSIHADDEQTTRQETLLRQILRDFEAHQVASARDRQALSDEVAALAEGLMLGKRLVLGQILALFAIIVFVGLTRGAPSIPLQLIHSPRAPARSAFAAPPGPRDFQKTRKGSSYVFEARSSSPVGSQSPRAFSVSRTSSIKRAKVGSPRRTLAAEPRPDREGRPGPPKAAKHRLARSQTPPPRLQDLAKTHPFPDRSLPVNARAAPPPLTLGPIRALDTAKMREPDRLAVPLSGGSRSGGSRRRQSSTSQWADWATETASSVATESESDDPLSLDATSDLDSPLSPGFEHRPGIVSARAPDDREATPRVVS